VRVTVVRYDTVVCVRVRAQPVMRRVVHDGEGHVIAVPRPRSAPSSAAGDWRWGPEQVPAAGREDGQGSAAAAAGGVSTVRYQELYSRASRHLVRVTASRVDAIANHTSAFGTFVLTAASQLLLLLPRDVLYSHRSFDDLVVPREVPRGLVQTLTK